MPAAHVRTRRGSEAAKANRLGGLTPATFLERYWHKRPLLARSALPGFSGFLDFVSIRALAGRDDVESRLVMREGARWTLAHGPFRRADFHSLPARNWTLLVQGVNLVVPEGDALLRRFSFLPFARLDDLMVSYAVPGGGVGPHFDSYDVFLLQGFGRRRWRYGRQNDLTLRRGLPLKILRRFAPDHAAEVTGGDLLYLPPQYAHDGVALDACTTYSIGFRAAGATELAQAFLDFLHDRVAIAGRYADPDLAPSREPARIAPAMRRQCARMLSALRWDANLVAEFVGSWLSEPKPTVFFEPPAHPTSRRAFLARAARRGVRLDMRTQLLYDDHHLFVNGSLLRTPIADVATIQRLANARTLPPEEVARANAASAALLYRWYRDGYLHTAKTR